MHGLAIGSGTRSRIEGAVRTVLVEDDTLKILLTLTMTEEVPSQKNSQMLFLHLSTTCMYYVTYTVRVQRRIAVPHLSRKQLTIFLSCRT